MFWGSFQARVLVPGKMGVIEGQEAPVLKEVKGGPHPSSHLLLALCRLLTARAPSVQQLHSALKQDPAPVAGGSASQCTNPPHPDHEPLHEDACCLPAISDTGARGRKIEHTPRLQSDIIVEARHSPTC